MEKDVKVIGKSIKNVFMVTLGTREIQFKKSELADKPIFELSADCKKVQITGMADSGIELYQNSAYPDYLCHAKPRLAGKTIFEHYDIYKEIVQFPLIESALKNIIDNNLIDEVIIVYTDQHDINQEEKKSLDNYNRDTVYYKNILELVLKDNFFKDNILKFSTIAVTEKVTDIDFQYNYFAEKCKLLFAEKQQINQIYLLPQGGIDQINHSLTLQLIQAFGYRVKLWQQAESSESRQLEFANLFLFDLLKYQIISLVRAADYHGAEMVAGSQPDERFRAITPLLEFARFRKLFLFKEAEKVAAKIGKKSPAFISEYCNKNALPEGLSLEINNELSVFMITERFYLADFYFRQENYTDFILSFQIFFETLVGQYLNQEFNVNLAKKHFESVTKLIRTIRENDPELYNKARQLLKLNESQDLEGSLPTLAVFAIEKSARNHDAVVNSQLLPLMQINSMLNGYSGACGIDKLRNMIAHEGKGVVEDDLYLATNEKIKRDKMAFWMRLNHMMRDKLGITDNAYESMGDFIIDKLNTGS